LQQRFIYKLLQVRTADNLLSLVLGSFAADLGFGVGFIWIVNLVNAIALNLITDGRDASTQRTGNSPVGVSAI
jgi:hypothetical protein